jgi:hypothetical protein
LNNTIPFTFIRILVLGFLFISFSSEAQLGIPENLKIITGPELKNDRNESVSQIIVKDENGTLVLGSKGDELVVYD